MGADILCKETTNKKHSATDSLSHSTIATMTFFLSNFKRIDFTWIILGNFDLLWYTSISFYCCFLSIKNANNANHRATVWRQMLSFQMGTISLNRTLWSWIGWCISLDTRRTNHAFMYAKSGYYATGKEHWRPSHSWWTTNLYQVTTRTFNVWCM